MYACMEVVHAALLEIKQFTIYLEFVFLSFAFIICETGFMKTVLIGTRNEIHFIADY